MITIVHLSLRLRCTKNENCFVARDNRIRYKLTNNLSINKYLQYIVYFDLNVIMDRYLSSRCYDYQTPRLPSCGIYILKLVRFARCCTSLLDFHSNNLRLISKLFSRGYRFLKLRYFLGKLLQVILSAFVQRRIYDLYNKSTPFFGDLKVFPETNNNIRFYILIQYFSSNDNRFSCPIISLLHISPQSCCILMKMWKNRRFCRIDAYLCLVCIERGRGQD